MNNPQRWSGTDIRIASALRGGSPSPITTSSIGNWSHHSAKLLAALTDEPQFAGEIARKAGLSSGATATALTQAREMGVIQGVLIKGRNAYRRKV